MSTSLNSTAVDDVRKHYRLDNRCAAECLSVFEGRHEKLIETGAEAYNVLVKGSRCLAQFCTAFVS